MLSTLIRRNKPRSEMSFMEHLDDLRISLIRVVFVFAVGMVVALIFYEKTPEFLGLPLVWAKYPEKSPISFMIGQPDPGLVAMVPLIEYTFMGVWKVLMYAAFGVGVGLASPVFLYETARFVGPALTDREKSGLIPFCIAAFFLFLMGATLAFMWLTPMSIQIWQHFAAGLGMEVTWQASDYYSFVVMMALLTGLTFQFPLALIIMMWLEIVRPKTLRKSWRGMLVGIMVLVALITPIAEPISLLVMTGVLFGFYLVAVAVGTVIVRRKRVARGDKPNPEDDDLDDDEDDDKDDDSGYRGSRYSDPVKPTTPLLGDSASPKPKSTPPPAEGDLSSLD